MKERPPNTTEATGGGNNYDAFISYSHALDGKLAPALQMALHRLGKPWYRPRALHLFRDQTSLSANPGLWSSIETALASSRYFVLLASPEAAASPWVRREVAYWRQHKSRDNLILIVTDGQVVWDEGSGDFDWTETTALPQALKGTFSEEPRFIDFRWARHSTDYSLRHPSFRDAVADIAAPLHGCRKDDLISEDIRQHRRSRRLARTAVVALAVLALLATSSAIVAVDQREQAERERDVAVSRQLAAHATPAVIERTDRALLLAVEAWNSAETAEARSALLAAVHRSPELLSFLQPTGGPAAQSVAFSPDGRILASGGYDYSVTLWDVESRQPRGEPLVGHRNWVHSVAFSEDGRTLASGSFDGDIILWDTATQRQLRTLTTHSQRVRSLAFSRDGNVLVSGSDDGDAALWRVQTGERLLAGHGEQVTSVALSPDSKLLATGGRDNQIVIWDLETEVRRGVLPGHTGQIDSMVFGRFGKTLISAGREGTVIEWDMETLQERSKIFDGDGSPVSKTALSGDGQAVAMSDEAGTIVVRGERVQELIGHIGDVRAIAFSPDGTLLASGGEDGSIRLWELYATRPRKEPVGHDVSSIAFSPDGSQMVSGGKDGAIVLWDALRREPLKGPTVVHSDEILSVAFGPDGVTVASGSRDGTVVLWDLVGGEAMWRLDTRSDQPVTSIAFSPDGQILATATGDVHAMDEKTVFLWDTQTGKQRGRPINAHAGEEFAIALEHRGIAISPDGTVLASAAFPDSRVLLYDLETGRQLRELTGQTEYVRVVAFSPNGEMLAAGGEKEVVLWDLSSGRPVASLDGFEGEVLSVSFSPDGQTLAAGDTNSTVRLWDVASRQRLGAGFEGAGGWVTSLAFTSDGRYLAFPAGQDILVRGLSAESFAAGACDLANRNLTADEWRQFFGPEVAYRRTCADLPPGTGAVET